MSLTKKIIFLVGIQIVFSIGMIREFKKTNRKKNVLVFIDDKLIIIGLFKNLVVSKAEILSLSAQKDFFSKVFDIHKISLITTANRMSIYTKEIDRHEMSMLESI